MTQKQSPNGVKIWSAWIQGLSNAPPAVRIILELWKELNHESEVHVLEGDEISDIIVDLGIDPKLLTPQVKTNLVRTFLLSKHGGAWVDSTLLPVVPLREWLGPELTSAGFFAFRSTGHESLILQNWFLYSEPSSILVTRWLDLYCDYFRRRRYQYPSKRAIITLNALDMIKAYFSIRNKDYMYFVDPCRGRNCSVYPYAIHNYTLAYLLEFDEEIRSIWKSVPNVFHLRPSVIGQCAADTETSRGVFEEVALDLLSISPVHKLNHRDPRFENMILKALERRIIG